VEITICTSFHYLTNLDIDKFNKQYPNLNIKYSNIFHDRFIIIDDNELYHVGASLKDLGKKCFAINKMNEENIKLLIKKGKFIIKKLSFFYLISSIFIRLVRFCTPVFGKLPVVMTMSPFSNSINSFALLILSVRISSVESKIGITSG